MIHITAQHKALPCPPPKIRQRVRYKRNRRTKQHKTTTTTTNNNNRDIKIDRGWEVRENGSHMQDINRKAVGIYKTYI